MANKPPGTDVTVASNPPKRTSPTDTGVPFVVVLSDRVPNAPKWCSSIADFPGSRLSSSVSYDWLDGALHEGVDGAYVQPAAGPAAAPATLNVPGTSGTGIVITAKDKGEWANGASGGYSAQVALGVGGAGVRTLILFFNGVEVDRSPDYAANADAVAYYANNADLKFDLGGGSGLTPVMAKTDLAAGTADRTSITVSTHVQAAFDKFSVVLGPGQPVAPDWRTDTARDIIKAHASTRGRFGVPDCDDGASKSTLLAAQAHLQNTTGASFTAGVPTSWLNAPPLATGGTARAVPGSALICGLMARNDADPDAGPAQPPAGAWGVSRWFTGVRTTFSPDTIAGANDAGDLDAAGCNWIAEDTPGGAPRAYAFNTCVSSSSAEGEFAQIGVARYRMSLVARGKALGRNYEGAKLNKRTTDSLHMDMEGELTNDYNRGDLFGDLDDDRPGTAFLVDTGSTVNTLQTLSAGRLRVRALVRPVKGGKFVEIAFTALDLTESIA